MNRESRSVREYLWSRALPGRLPLAALALILIYQSLAFPQDYSVSVLYVLVALLLCLVLRAPRWLIYVVLFAALVLQVRYVVDVLSRLPAFEVSTRDVAAEATARALLRGQNPWNHTPELKGVLATTGPASVLLAVPFVWVFDEINWLAFGFWVSFFVVLAVSDLHQHNSTFPGLALIFLLGVFGFAVTLQFSLDELYFPVLWIVAAYVAISYKQWLLAGILLAAAVLSRADYVFLVAGLLLWLAGRATAWARRPWLMLGAGSLLGAALILAPFVLVGGREFFSHNPFQNAADLSGTPFPAAAHPVFAWLNSVAAWLGTGGLRIIKLSLIFGILVGLAWLGRARAWPHPFWHVTAGAFLGHTIGWFPAPLAMDYALIFVLPAMLAVAIEVRARPSVEP